MFYKGTTIIGLIKDGKAVMGGDGQVTFGNMIIKRNAVKVRKIYQDKVLVGFAGAVADALTLFEKMEEKLKKTKGNLSRAVVELARDWRTDKILRRLEAQIIVMDKTNIFIVSGSGEVIEPEDKLAGIGSGAGYALSAAKALLKFSNLDAKKIVEESLKIASEICLYTNQNIKILEID